jgi:hypothetical protein
MFAVPFVWIASRNHTLPARRVSFSALRIAAAGAQTLDRDLTVAQPI